MAESSSLRDAWLHAPDGRLCAREQAKAWALREIWNEEGKSSYGLLPWVAQRLKTNVGGSPTGDPPSPPAIAQFFSKLDDDPDWYPGKRCGEKPGPKRVLRGSKKTAIVAAAKRLKKEGTEPTYSAIVAACPAAVVNPATDTAVDPKLVYNVFREACYDDDADTPWDHLPLHWLVALWSRPAI